jgi:hypothetical protein
MHVGWVPDERGVYHGQLAVLVKPNGMLGACYLAAIRPLRTLIVYPRMMRDVGQRWRDNAAERSATPAGRPPRRGMHMNRTPARRAKRGRSRCRPRGP